MWVLVAGLPSDAAIRRDGKQWTQRDELAAIAIERNDGWMRLLAVGQGRKSDRVPPLPSIKHPDRASTSGAEARKQMSSSTEIKSFLDRLRR